MNATTFTEFTGIAGIQCATVAEPVTVEMNHPMFDSPMVNMAREYPFETFLDMDDEKAVLYFTVNTDEITGLRMYVCGVEYCDTNYRSYIERDDGVAVQMYYGPDFDTALSRVVDLF